MFLKFTGQSTDQFGTPLHWGRAGIDGAPFRGSQPPMLKAEEAETLLERTRDLFYGTFDTSKPDQKHFGHTLANILEGCGNSWYTIIRWNESWATVNNTPVMHVFVVWEVPYMEATSKALGRGSMSNFITVNTNR